MLLDRSVGQPLGNAEEYRKLPTGKCPKVIAEFLNAIKRILRNPQI
jgi:hypothetical protein